MEFLYLLEDIRFPLLDKLMLGVTFLGDELPFLIVAMILFWCVDKQVGYYVLSVGFIGTAANQFMKLCFRVPRPWIRDASFTIVEQAREAASGYSFPSGHTQSSVGTFGSIAYITKNKVLRILCMIAVVLVPFSRMYLGVHTPLDVCVAAVMAVILIIVLKSLVFSKKRWAFPVLLGIMIAIAVAFSLFVECYPFPANMDEHNLASAQKNAYTLIGSLLGLVVVYIVDEKRLHFSTKAVWWAQILKIFIGLGLALAVKEGLRAPLEALCGVLLGRSIRYFLIVVVSGIVWPLSFKWFSKLGMKA